MTDKAPESFRDTATPQLFLRNATGLVKGWSRFDAFVYSYMSVNFVTLGLYFSLSVLPFVATGQVIPALIISAIFVSFLVFSYAGLISVMPRAGGDYVWQSRLLPPGIGFVLAVTGWWFILWYWTPIYANIISIEVLQPIAAVLKSPAAITWLASDTGVFVVCVAVTILAGAMVALGMKGYAQIQKMCFYIGGLGLLIMFVIMIFTSHGHFITAFNSAAHHLFGKQGNVYAQTLTVAAKGNSYIAPAHLGVSPFFGQSLLLIPILCFWILYPNWGATLYGEVRGAGDFRGVLRGMMAGLWVTFAIAIVFLFLVEKTFGWQFFNAANMNYWGAVYGSKAAPTIPVWSFPPLLVSFLIPTAALRAIFLLVFATWFIGWAGTLFLSSTRVVFAAAFDRILPEKTSYVSERRHVPVWGLILMLVPSLVVSALYAYTSEFKTFVLDAVLVPAVSFFGTLIASMILPWRKRELFESSVVGRYRIAGVPVIAVTSGLAAIFIGWNIYQWLTNSTYGVNNRTSLIFMGAMYALAIVIYVIAKLVRRRQGINLKVVYGEIPAE
ncbi:MAG TPA: APC family permease [Jatrophihabitantaceae bacterium]|nr:APC family permease [Jatrophihabitantaceae bacterium]